MIPAAGISTTARDLASSYQSLLDAGSDGATGVFDAATVAQACRPSSDGERDGFLGFRVRWSQGFQLGGPDAEPGQGRAMGRLGSSLTFGHNGSNCCIGWADPTPAARVRVPVEPAAGRRRAPAPARRRQRRARRLPQETAALQDRHN